MGWQRVGHDRVTNRHTTYTGLMKGQCLNSPTTIALLEKVPSKRFENTVSVMCKLKAIIWSRGHFTENSIAFLNTTLHSVVKHQHACSCFIDTINQEAANIWGDLGSSRFSRVLSRWHWW